MNSLLAIPAFIETGVLKIATVDIAVLVILIIAFIIGYIRGFMRQILSLLGIVLSLILAVIFCDDLANFIKNNVPSITNWVQGFIKNLFGTILSENYDSAEALTSALSQSKIPAFLHGLISNLIINSNFDVKLIDILTTWALNVLSFVGIVVVSTILFIVIKLLFKVVTNIPIIRKVDKTLGVIFSCLIALIVIILICSVLSIFINVNAYLEPGNGVICVFSKVMEFIINLPFVKNLYTIAI